MKFDKCSLTAHQGWALKARLSLEWGCIRFTAQPYSSHAFSLTEPCSNNVAEYNTLLIGLQLAQQMGVQYLETYGDSKLIVNQIKREYEVRQEDLISISAMRLASKTQNQTL